MAPGPAGPGGPCCGPGPRWQFPPSASPCSRRPVPGAARFAARLAAAVAILSRQAPRAQPAMVSASPFAGAPAVGALFQVTAGGLGRHFCTATVMASPVKDLVITAAHYVYGRRPGDIAFVPGYRNSSHPYGTWGRPADRRGFRLAGLAEPEPRRGVPGGRAARTAWRPEPDRRRAGRISRLGVLLATVRPRHPVAVPRRDRRCPRDALTTPGRYAAAGGGTIWSSSASPVTDTMSPESPSGR